MNPRDNPYGVLMDNNKDDLHPLSDAEVQELQEAATAAMAMHPEVFQDACDDDVDAWFDDAPLKMLSPLPDRQQANTPNQVNKAKA